MSAIDSLAKMLASPDEDADAYDEYAAWHARQVAKAEAASFSVGGYFMGWQAEIAEPTPTELAVANAMRF